MRGSASPPRPNRSSFQSKASSWRQTWRTIRRYSRWVVSIGLIAVSAITLFQNYRDRIPFLPGEETTSSQQSEGLETPGADPGNVNLNSFIDLSSVSATEAARPATNALDGDRSTGWIPCDECASLGSGAVLIVPFSQTVAIKRIEVFNGIEGDAQAGPVESITIEAGYGPVDITLGGPVNGYEVAAEFGETNEIRLVVGNVVGAPPGAYSAIGEIRFWGEPVVDP